MKSVIKIKEFEYLNKSVSLLFLDLNLRSRMWASTGGFNVPIAPPQQNKSSSVNRIWTKISASIMKSNILFLNQVIKSKDKLPVEKAPFSLRVASIRDI